MEGNVAILGLGNVLMGDDAAGPYAIEYLCSQFDLPDTVAIEDLGTPGLDILPHIAGRDRIILLDTVRSDGPAGEIRLYRKDQILAHAPSARIGPHDPGVKETLLSLEFAGKGPADVLLVGVIPERTDSTIGLSGPVRASIPLMIQHVVDELETLGYHIARRTDAREPSPWWEREA